MLAVPKALNSLGSWTITRQRRGSAIRTSTSSTIPRISTRRWTASSLAFAKRSESIPATGSTSTRRNASSSSKLPYCQIRSSLPFKTSMSYTITCRATFAKRRLGYANAARRAIGLTFTRWGSSTRRMDNPWKLGRNWLTGITWTCFRSAMMLTLRYSRSGAASYTTTSIINWISTGNRHIPGVYYTIITHYTAHEYYLSFWVILVLISCIMRPLSITPINFIKTLLLLYILLQMWTMFKSNYSLFVRNIEFRQILAYKYIH